MQDEKKAFAIHSKEEASPIYASPKNTNAKIAVLGAEHMLGSKIYEMLKRRFSAVGIQYSMVSDSIEYFDITNVKKLISYFEYSDVRIVVFTSESLIENGDSVISLIKCCRRNFIKIIFFALKYVAELAWDDYEMNRFLLRMEEKNNEIISMLGNSSLIVNIDCCYGETGRLKVFDFPTVCQAERNHIHSFLNVTDSKPVSPVLADEAGIWLLDHISDNGVYYLAIENPVTFEKWKTVILEERTAKQDFYQRKNNMSFCSIESGKNVTEHQKRCVFKLVYQYSPADVFGGGNVGDIRIRLGRLLAGSIPFKIAELIDFVCPVPQTGLYYAMGLADGLNLPYVQALEKRGTKIRSFQIQDNDIRKEIMWSKIRPVSYLLKDKTVALVDEAIFTGTTLKIVCEMLRECGVKQIYICIPTPRCSYHCEYLVHPDRRMLLEYIREDMLSDYFDADGVYFQKDDNFLHGIPEIESACMECFYGKGEGKDD